MCSRLCGYVSRQQGPKLHNGPCGPSPLATDDVDQSDNPGLIVS
jgi:hypothetical protein